jgi:homoserine O-acetyltransferase/O-succinyltransferase
MPDVIPADSVGLVAPQTHHFTQPLLLACGKTLDEYQLVYETYGQLNAAKSNAVLICHALSGHHHAAGYHSMDDKRPGWWDSYIGPSKPIDTNKYFVVALNNIGGCHGSTGPRSINSATGKVWGADFPMIRVRDWVASQACLADALGIDCWAAIVGGSLGGMQVMRWALQYPERIRHAIVIASALKLSTQNIAFNEAARKAIMSDPNFHDGHYLDHDSLPKNGLAIARMIGHITYLSDYAMGEKFGRDLRSGNFNLGNAEPVEFQIESYLRYQGDSFANTFDANSYLRITKALDYFDLAREYDDDPVIAFKQARAKFLVISFSTDWRFAPERSREIVNALVGANKAVTYAEIESKFGHDAFLLPDERYQQVFARYMAGVSV